MIISVVYTIIGLIFCFVLYLAFKAINTGMEAKKANKDLENSNNISSDNQEAVSYTHLTLPTIYSV